MTQNDVTRDQIKNFLLETIKVEKPATTKELIALVQQRTKLEKAEIETILIELENEQALRFRKQVGKTPPTAKGYLFSEKAAWYWTIIIVAVATTIAVFAIPENAYPIVYMRTILGIAFVLFLPGFAFIKALFPTQVPLRTNSESLDAVERLALGVGVSLALTPLVGLALNYTPWGITLTASTLSLLLLTVVFASVAILREQQATTPQVS
jgi:hypothetical protein